MCTGVHVPACTPHRGHVGKDKNMEIVKPEVAAAELGKTAETIRVMMSNNEFSPPIGEVKTKNRRGEPLKRKTYWIYREWLDRYKAGAGSVEVNHV